MLFTNIYLYLFVVHVSNTSKFLSKYALFQKRALRHWLFVNLFLFVVSVSVSIPTSILILCLCVNFSCALTVKDEFVSFFIFGK